MQRRQKQKGFTIVELLIVIVVIGILAAMTIVAYNGVSERARMSSAMAFESQLRKKYMIDSTGIWSFDECSGFNVRNASDTNTNDAITGTVTWITDTATGQGCALRFNGSTTRIETQAKLGAQYYVKGAWVRVTTANCGSNNIISQGSTNGAIAAFYTPSCRTSSGHNGSWNTVQSPSLINDGKWHYVAVEWRDGVLKLYIDGVTVASASGVPVPTNATGTVAIGAHGGGNMFTGDIDNPFVAAQ